jgi:hypothetical protein
MYAVFNIIEKLKNKKRLIKNMLEGKIISEIENYVYSGPKTIQEISKKIGKSWITADRYVARIENEIGTISTRTFRGGTRGALKIAFWASAEKAGKSVFQEKLEKEIFFYKKKEDFSPFDIFQHVPDGRKDVSLEKSAKELLLDAGETCEFVRTAKRQILIFSGNLSIINLKDKENELFSELVKSAKRGVKIKVICRIDLQGIKNVKKALSLNYASGVEAIEIRHREQPLRAIICDDSAFRIKEMKEPTGKLNEFSEKISIFYAIKDKPWTNWISHLFWKMFSESFDAEKRMTEIEKIALLEKD